MIERTASSSRISEFALEMAKATPDTRKIDELARQSELSTEQALVCVSELASVLVGLLARTQGVTREAILARLADMLDKTTGHEAP